MSAKKFKNFEAKIKREKENERNRAAIKLKKSRKTW